MSVLSASTEKQVEDLLVHDGVLTSSKLEELRKKAHDSSSPLFSLLVTEQHISDEVLTHTIAKVTGVPYVNLSNVTVDPEILALLPQEVAERYMAVPLGEMQHRLVVAMLDADNVQAVDFLANKIGRPLKVYVASEAGIRQVLKQYSAKLDEDVVNAISLEPDEVKTPSSEQTKAQEINIKN